MTTDPTPASDLPVGSKGHDLGFERLVFFSDAVFAIAMTLLVLDLRLQTGPQGQILIDRLVPKLIGFVISFSVTSFYWLDHHRLFKTLRAEDPWLRAVNLVFLGCVVFLAFPTSVISEYVATPWAVILYALSVATTGLVKFCLVLVSRRPGLMQPGEATGCTLRLGVRALAVPTVFIGTCLLAVHYPSQAMLSWMVLPIVIRGLDWIGAKAGHRLDRARP